MKSARPEERTNLPPRASLHPCPMSGIRSIALAPCDNAVEPAERHVTREDVTALCALAARHGFKAPRGPPDMTGPACRCGTDEAKSGCTRTTKAFAFGSSRVQQRHLRGMQRSRQVSESSRPLQWSSTSRAAIRLCDDRWPAVLFGHGTGDSLADSKGAALATGRCRSGPDGELT